ncbi:MAG TPA: FG-GAP-like repeat-containing protein [bacterium]|nr:FG-GAP-like repeat-containing protein [bacterium]
MYRIFIFIWTTILFLSAEDIKIQWESVDSFPGTPHSIFKFNSSDSLYIATTDGSIIYKNNSNWKKISPPQSKEISFVDYNYYWVNNNFIIGSLIDQNFNNHYYSYNGKNWQKYKTVSSAPNRYFLQDGNGNIINYGDWGNIYKIAPDKIVKISNPIENHIMTARKTRNGQIIFGTRDEGLYLMESNKFINIPLPDSLSADIRGIVPTEDNYFKAYTTSGYEIKFSLKNKKISNIKKIFQDQNIQYHFNSDTNGIAIPNITKSAFLYQDTKWKHIRLVENEDIKKAYFYNNTDIFLISIDNHLYKGKLRSGSFFTDRTNKYHLEGGNYENSSGFAIFDINKDNYDDILVINSGDNQFSRLYINAQGQNFNDVTSEYELRNLGDIQKFTYSDFNYDGNIDFVLLDDNNILKIYFSYNQDLFAKRLEIGEFKDDFISRIQTIDFNRDDRQDLFISSLYTQGRKPGGEIVQINKNKGYSFTRSNKIFEKTRGWNPSSLFSDFNDDKIKDIYVSTKWLENKLLISQGEKYLRDSSAINRKDSSYQFTRYSIGIDFDNDGDLDIIDSNSKNFGLTLFENINGQFEDQTDKYLPEKIRETTPSYLLSGDMNNDGNLDILFSDLTKRKNYLLINNGKTFQEKSREYSISTPFVTGAGLIDIDNDGDLDVFGIRRGTNVVWENQTNSDNYLEIELISARYYPYQTGTVIEIYESGHLNNQDFLYAHKEIGTAWPGSNMYSMNRIHFGVPSDKSFDIKIVNNDETIVRKNIHPAQILKIYPDNKIYSWIYQKLSSLLFLLRLNTTYSFLISIAAAACFIFIGVRVGYKYFYWTNLTTGLFVFINVSLFWIIYIGVRNNPNFINYLYPGMAVFIGCLLPLISTYSIYKRSTVSRDEALEKLFNNILDFNHGEWAYSTINSLHLLCKNPPTDLRSNQNFKKRVRELAQIYSQAINKELREIYSQARQAKIDEELLSGLSNYFDEINENIEKITKEDTIDRELLLSLDNYLRNYKKYLRNIREVVFDYFSCDAIEVIKNVTNSFKNKFQQENIHLHRVLEDELDYTVLIQPNQLGRIIDNLITNSIKALRGCNGSKNITLKLSSPVSKVNIDITNNGPAIPEGIQKKIFESSFSTTDSSGQGLYISRNLLQKYRGNLKLLESDAEKTTMRIELIKRI